MDKNYVEVDGTVLVNLRDDTLSSASQVAAGVTAHLRTGRKVTGTGTGESNVLSGKIASFTGDSICYGAGYTGGYAKIIGDDYGMTVQNIAVGGATVANIGAGFTICESISSMRADADYVILEGGGNDSWYNTTGVTIGQITSGYTDSLNINTFAGAMEQMFKSALARFPEAKIGYIFIHKCSDNFDSRTTGSYYNVAKAACEKWGIPYCDLNTLAPPLGHITALAQAYTINGGDGIHPTEEGYRLFYVPKIVAWMKTL